MKKKLDYIPDKIVEQVVDKLRSRSSVGVIKYGTTLYDNNTDDFLTHAIEESLDFVLYLTKIKSILAKKGLSRIEGVIWKID